MSEEGDHEGGGGASNRLHSSSSNPNYNPSYNTSPSYTYTEPGPSGKSRSRMGRSASIVLATLTHSSSSMPRPEYIIQFIPSSSESIPTSPPLLHPMSSSAPSSGDLAATVTLPSTFRSGQRVRELQVGSDDLALVEEWQSRFQKAMSSREIRGGNILDRVLLRLDYSHYARKSMSSQRQGSSSGEGGVTISSVPSSAMTSATNIVIATSSPSSMTSSVPSSRTASPGMTRPSTAEGHHLQAPGSSPGIVVDGSGNSGHPPSGSQMSHGSSGHSPNSLTISHAEPLHRSLHPSSTPSPLSGVSIPSSMLGLAYLTEDEDRLSRSISPIQQAVARRREARQYQQHLQRLRERRSMPALRERQGSTGGLDLHPPIPTPPPLPQSFSGTHKAGGGVAQGRKGSHGQMVVVRPTEDDGSTAPSLPSPISLSEVTSSGIINSLGPTGTPRTTRMNSLF